MEAVKFDVFRFQIMEINLCKGHAYDFYSPVENYGTQKMSKYPDTLQRAKHFYSLLVHGI